MRWRRWHAIPVTLSGLTLTMAIGSVVMREAPPVESRRGTLSGVTACTSGSLWLGRFDCSGAPCDDTPFESVFLRWDEREVSVRFETKAWAPPRSEREVDERIAKTEWPIPRSLLPRLLAEFAALPHRPAEPPWLPDARLRDIFEAGGECDREYVSADLTGRRLDLVATLKSAPLDEAPRVLMLSLRGPGPRAARLFGRLEKLARH